MEITLREWFGTVHGLIFGALFLLSFSGGLVALYGLRPEWMTADGIKSRMTQLKAWVWGMAAIAWATVLTGTYIVYPWYRATPPDGTTDLSAFAKFFLLSNEATAKWHEFGMEWKEHVGWIAPIAATVVAYVISVYGAKLISEPKIRKALTWFFVASFTAAGIAGVLGAFITKAAPVR
jgi:hypothetical protein